MTDTPTKPEGADQRYKCPVNTCEIKMRPVELEAHLEWDHNYSARRAEDSVNHLRGMPSPMPYDHPDSNVTVYDGTGNEIIIKANDSVMIINKGQAQALKNFLENMIEGEQ